MTYIAPVSSTIISPRSLVYSALRYPVPGVSAAKILVTEGFSLENVVDPTGAGESFAGEMIGYLASKKTTKISEIKKAVVYGNVLGSFAVERYGLDGLLKIKFMMIFGRHLQFFYQSKLSG